MAFNPNIWCAESVYVKTIEPFVEEDYKFDIIGALPLEISLTIFRNLDPQSMYAAIQVRRRWYHIFKSDKKLQKMIRDKARKEKKKRELLRLNYMFGEDCPSPLRKKFINKDKKKIKSLKNSKKCKQKRRLDESIRWKKNRRI